MRTSNIEIIIYTYVHCQGASLVAQMVKKMPAMQETWVQSLGRKDPPLENEMATDFSIFA